MPAVRTKFPEDSYNVRVLMKVVRRKWWATEAPPEKRLGYRPDVLCDDCQIQNGSERHHMLYRSFTAANDAIRLMGESPLLSAWLCRECHEKADTEEKRIKYWAQNKEFFGPKYAKDFRFLLIDLQRAGIEWRWE